MSADATREVEEAEKSVGDDGPDPPAEDGATRLRAPLESILIGEVEDLRGGEDLLDNRRLFFGPRPLTMEGVMETIGAVQGGGNGDGVGEEEEPPPSPPPSFCGERCLLSSAAAAAFVSWSSLSLFCHSRA